MKSARSKVTETNSLKEEESCETVIRKRDRAATETAILLAAIQVFAKKGYDAANTKDIAKLANANEALIFRYFGNKKGLLEAILTRAEDIKSEESSSRSTSKNQESYQDLEASLQYSMSGKCRDFHEAEDFMKVAVSQIILDPEVSQIIHKKIYTKAIPEFTAELEKFKKAGKIDPKADLKSVAYAISALTFALGFMGQCVYKIPPAEIQATIKEVSKIFRKGLEPESTKKKSK
ncbi:TetR/AcrR family transcriptional regulator [Leptospira gomenensis]|uniref:TetR/AcrR family transcriptional regulator n=1 Tax=Leptospira gomenensis TaxID=2484974 RepID=A0A5F1YFA0_9LEPT|nr:TetR/AcrR family transcriptional regulator [Leptospira gomenensis]TGK32624.1 TetR/AcrR family transcriptional regulator [Leptospira gomenensis]TGK38501.1 TetR/AcrR family transcriptional regulator [Leptospira gomenensis]TGK52260.1 TetR/AcrR family transcriptional regulator [Leptospira gomenensis]TGK63011.1 TetR/AcrR family transcriptional regulator [Leptospira gomenensis]